jgi:hypothetical protein
MSSFQVLTFDGLKQKRVVSADSVFDFSSIRVGADNLQIQQNGSGASAAFDFGGRKLYNVAAPSPTDDISMVATKGYVDAVAAGLDPKEAVRLATAIALPACTYANGTDGVGATLTADANGLLGVDGQNVVAGNRILVKDQATQAHNGVYVVTAAGDAGNPFVLTRSSDFDGSPAQEVNGGEYVFVKEGAVNADSGFVVSSPNTDATIGTTAIVFTQFSQAGTVNAGAGLTKTGTTIDVVAGDNSLDVQTDSVAVKKSATGAIGLAADGIKINLEAANPTLKIADNEVGVKFHNGLTSGANGLTVSVDGTTLALGAGGIKVAADGITATEIAASVAGDGLTGGAGSALAVGAGNGISVAADAVSVAADATGGANLAKAINVSSNGVAVKVDDASIEGDATSGQLKIKDGGVVEAKIGALAVTEGKIGALAVTDAKIADGAVVEAKIGALAVTEGKIGALAVSEGKIAAGAVTVNKIGDDAVTAAKINSDVAGAGLVQNVSGALDVGAGEAITVSADAIAVDFTLSLQADESVVENDVCYIKSNGHVAKAQANIDLSAAELVIATASVASSAFGAFVARRGGVKAGFSGLTPGAKLYVSRGTAGALVADLTGFVAGESVYSIGRAKSATEIIYAPQFEFEY